MKHKFGSDFDFIPGNEDNQAFIASNIHPFANTDDRFYQTRLTPAMQPWGFMISGDPFVATGHHTPYFIPGEQDESYHPVATGDALEGDYVMPPGGGAYMMQATPGFGADPTLAHEVMSEAALAGTVSAAAILGSKLAGVWGAVIGAGLGAVLGPKVFTHFMK